MIYVGRQDPWLLEAYDLYTSFFLKRHSELFAFGVDYRFLLQALMMQK